MGTFKTSFYHFIQLPFLPSQNKNVIENMESHSIGTNIMKNRTLL